jgi:5-methylcytosine-specific restriction endonuclease McrA
MKKKWRIKERIDDQAFIQACREAQTMAQAASTLGLHFNSFKKRALELGCYEPNQAGKGIKKKAPRIPIEDIIRKGKHPQYQSYKLKKRLIKQGIKANRCESCRLDKWNGKALNLELHHIDGDRTNHNLNNLQLLCPNCHSQTDTFRARNRK